MFGLMAYTGVAMLPITCVMQCFIIRTVISFSCVQKPSGILAVDICSYYIVDAIVCSLI